MIDLYTWKTPNGRKPAIMLEEIGLPYTLKPIDIGAGEQQGAEFLKISPNGKIPGIIDHEAAGGPLALFESGAILIYLADKSGELLARTGAARYHALAWLSWQLGGLGPMLGQLGFFFRQKERNEPAFSRAARHGDPAVGFRAAVRSQVAPQPATATAPGRAEPGSCGILLSAAILMNAL